MHSDIFVVVYTRSGYIKCHVGCVVSDYEKFNAFLIKCWHLAGRCWVGNIKYPSLCTESDCSVMIWSSCLLAVSTLVGADKIINSVTAKRSKKSSKKLFLQPGSGRHQDQTAPGERWADSVQILSFCCILSVLSKYRPSVKRHIVRNICDVSV